MTKNNEQKAKATADCAPMTYSVRCWVCLGTGEKIERNYLFKEVGKSKCYQCGGTGMTTMPSDRPTGTEKAPNKQELDKWNKL